MDPFFIFYYKVNNECYILNNDYLIEYLMSSYIKFLLEDSNKPEFPKTVALIAGSYKPPTIGHLSMVEYYASVADEVIILISSPKAKNSMRLTSLGTVISPEMSQKIWEIYLKAYHLTNVQAIISPLASPIKAMFEYVDNNLKDVNVIFGSSTKDGDVNRIKTAQNYYVDNPHINMLNPIDTAVEPYKSRTGNPVSATDIRNNIDNPDVIKTMLPDKLTDIDKDKVIKILQSGEKLTESQLDCSLEPLDETEAIHLTITDDLLRNAKIAAYNNGQVLQHDDNKSIPYNPKKFPTKAIDIVIPLPNTDTVVEIFLDTESKTWDSHIFYNNQHIKLAPDQMGEFFNSKFYFMLASKLTKAWPLSDKFFRDLYLGVLNREMFNDIKQTIVEVDVDKSMANKDIDGDDKRDFTAGGRKIINFSDNNVTTKNSAFQCWPNTKHPFKYTQWKDWKKIKPLCRIRFYHNGIPYGISLSTLGEDRDYKNRGFRGYSLDPSLPPVQWLTSEENQSIIKLTIVNKFIKRCIQIIQPYVDMTPEEIYEKIDNKDKITINEIAKTRSCIRKTLNEVIKTRQIDNFKWN